MRLDTVRNAMPAVPAPPAPVAAGGDGMARRQPRYVTRLPIKKRADVNVAQAPAAPMSCWHVWITDGLVADAAAQAPSDAFAGVFARAEAVAAERAAAYRATALDADDDAPPAGFTLDLRA